MRLGRIVVIGRGGSGKTTFTALLARYLLEKGERPILLVDADPDENLAEMVGFEVEEGRTISDLLAETLAEEDDGGTRPQRFPIERVEYRIWEEALYEEDGLDLISIGAKWTEGCYCVANEALRMVLGNMLRSYAHVLIDSPAGLEQLNRRIAPAFDDIFDIIDPSQKALSHVGKARRLLAELKIAFRNFYVVGGYRLPEGWGADVEALTGLKCLGKVAYDPAVEEHVRRGGSLMGLPPDSPAYASLRRVAELAGY